MRKSVKTVAIGCLSLALAVMNLGITASGAAEFTDDASIDGEYAEEFTAGASEENFVDDIGEEVPEISEDAEKALSASAEYEEEISGYFFYRRDGLGNITITEYAGKEETVNVPTEIKGFPVVKIGKGAFKNNASVVTINMPGITEIEAEAFYRCEKLEHVNGSKVTIVGMNAFSACPALRTAELPVVETIGRYAFEYSGIEEADFPKAAVVGGSAFSNCKYLHTVSLPELKKVESSTFWRCESLQTATVNMADEIGSGAFEECTALKNVSVVNCEILHGTAFDNCISLEKIHLPQVREIGQYAFWNCKKLSSVSLSDKLTSVGSWAFMDCYSLKEISLYRELKEIGSYAFGYVSDYYGKPERKGDITLHCEEGSQANMYAVRNDCSVTFHKYVERLEQKATFDEHGYYAKVCEECGYREDYYDIAPITSFALSAVQFEYNGKVQQPKVVVYDCDNKQIDPKYYTVAYSGESVEIGTYKVYIKLQGWYEGKITEKYKIIKPQQEISVSNQTLTMGTSKAVGAKLVKGNGKLTYKSDNTKIVAVSSTGKLTPKSVGRTNVYITANKTSKYDAKTKKITVTVLPRAPKITEVASGTGKLKITWTKSPDAHGYVLYRSTSPKGTYSKIKALSGSGTLSYTNTGLASNTKYYYKVRAYRTVSGKNYYSEYSNIKSKTTKNVTVVPNGTYENRPLYLFQSEAQITVYKNGGTYYAKLYGRGGKMNTTVRLYKSGDTYNGYYSDGGLFLTISDVTASKMYVDFAYLDEFCGWYYK